MSQKGPILRPNATPFFSCEWHGHILTASTPGLWFVSETEEPLSANHWELYYPGVLKLQHLNQHTLKGKYKGKTTRWSVSNKCFQYLNHTPVNFDSPAPSTVVPVTPTVPGTFEDPS